MILTIYLLFGVKFFTTIIKDTDIFYYRILLPNLEIINYRRVLSVIRIGKDTYLSTINYNQSFTSITELSNEFISELNLRKTCFGNAL